MIGYLLNCIKKNKNRKEWRKRNLHNFTKLGKVYDYRMISVGNNSYGTLNVNIANKKERLYIGSYCSIADEVNFILSADHYTNNISTFPFRSVLLRTSKLEGISKGDIIVDDDVWIGYGVTILSGVHIGQGAVVAAGAIVTNDIPPYTIVGGIPAKIIKQRFTDEITNYLLTLDFSRLNDSLVKEHVDDLYVSLNDNSLEKIKKMYEWFPKHS